MTNAIPNVPRELLERVKSLCEYWFVCGQQQHMSATEYKTWHALGFGSSAFTELRAILSAPSPAGVDGCKCSMSIRVLGDGCRHCQPQEYIDRLGEMLDEERAELSDAQAIIDGLRGEVAEERAKVAQLEEGIPRIMEASYQFRQQRDQQAHRIGELEGLLREADKKIVFSEAESWNDVFAARIDAALSAGKEG